MLHGHIAAYDGPGGGPPGAASPGAAEGVYTAVGVDPWNVATLDEVSGEARHPETGSWVALSGRAWWRERTQSAPAPLVTPGELLLRLLERGIASLREMDGSFAVAWFDGRRGELCLARDYFGIEPLHYHAAADRAVFASRMTKLLEALPAPVRLCSEGLHDYLAHGFCPGEATLVEGVKRVPPGGAVILRLMRGRLEATVSEWYRLRFGEQPLERDAYIIDAFRAALENAVRARLGAGSPAVMLSGGMDSSAVATLAHRHQRGAIRSFTFRCGGAAFDESIFARELAAELGLEHVQVNYTEVEALGAAEAVAAMDCPLADAGIEIGSWLLARATAGHGGYILTGDGGDEFWASHPVYAAQRLVSGYERLVPWPTATRWLRKSLNRFDDSDKKRDLRVIAKRLLPDPALPRELRHIRWKTYYTPQEIRVLLNGSPAARPADASCFRSMLAAFGGRDAPAARHDAMLFNDYRTASAFYFSRLLFFRHFGVEPRMPFFDVDLVELGARIPFHKKLEKIETTKRLFRTAMRGIVPDVILDRRDKLGHSVPMKNWLRRDGPLHDTVAATVLEGLAGRRGLVDRAVVERFLKEHRTARENHSHRLWALAVLESWLQKHVDARAAPLQERDARVAV